MTTLAPDKPKRTLEDIERGLTALALTAGRPVQASDRLKEQGLDIPASTLCRWRDHQYHERYLEIATTVAYRVEDVIVQEARETAALAAQLERAALERAYRQVMNSKEGVDASQVAQRASTVKGINVDKLLQLTGRPTQVVEHRNADEVLRKLGASLPGLIVDGTATEIEPKAIPSQSSAIGTGRKQ